MKDKSMSSDPILKVPPEAHFLPVAVSLTEQSARAWDLGEQEILSLILATEEVFLTLAGVGQDIELKCVNGGYFVQLEFHFSALAAKLLSSSLEKLNLTAHIEMEVEEDLEQLGLLLAARSVDYFRVEQLSDDKTVMRLKQNKRYPESEATVSGPLSASACEVIRAPSFEELDLLCRRIVRDYSKEHYSLKFSYPTMISDMIAYGHLQALVALNPQGDVVGGLLIENTGRPNALGHGPYLFGQGPETAERLLEHALSDLGRTRTLGLVIETPSPDLPLTYVDLLGSFRFKMADGNTVHLKSYYRQLQEDDGHVVWADPAIHPFLRGEYDRLLLPRELYDSPKRSDPSPQHSVLATDFDRYYSEVTLSPMIWGQDAAENLQGHLISLQREGWQNIRFHLDLGQPEFSQYAPILLAEGFSPSFLLPDGGRADVIVFQPGAKP